MVFEAFYYGISVAGYPSVIVGLMVLGGVQLIMIGVVGEYIGKILSEIKARPIYFVAEHSVKTAQDRSAGRAASAAGADGGGMSDAPARPIWLCADDYGISPAVNGAIRDLVVRGRINATSVMVVAPSFDRSEAVPLGLLNAGATRVAIGLHVTLTAPFAPLSAGFRAGAGRRVPAAGGHAAPRAAAPAVAQAAGGRDRDAARGVRRPRSAARPISSTGISTCICFRRCATRCSRGQGGRAERLGAPVRPRAAAAAAAVGRQEGAAARRAQPRASGGAPPRSASPPIRRSPAPTISPRRTCRISPRCSRRFLDRLPAGGLVMCHPGKVDAELERLDPLTDAARARIRLLRRRRLSRPARVARCRAGLRRRRDQRLSGRCEILSGAIPPRPAVPTLPRESSRGRRKPMTPQERKLVDELFDRLQHAGERAARSGRRSTPSTRAWNARRTRSIRWCSPCWCRTRRSSAPTRASASWKRSSASSSRKPRAAGRLPRQHARHAVRHGASRKARCRRCAARSKLECLGPGLQPAAARRCRASSLWPAAIWRSRSTASRSSPAAARSSAPRRRRWPAWSAARC